MSSEVFEKFNRLQKLISEANELFSWLSREISRLKDKQAMSLSSVAEQLGYTKIDLDLFRSFLEKPYVILPRKKDEWFLVVPRFIDLQIGWLWHQTESYNIFVVNRYIDWIYPLPPEIKSELGFKEPPFKPVVDGDHLICRPEEMDSIWERYKQYLSRREAPGRIRVKRKRHFDLICALVRDGILPFKPKPVDREDLLDREPDFKLRDYQREAWKYFLKFGNIGVYWPPSVGKRWFAMYVMTKLKGKKLVVVPTRTLAEEWENLLKKYTPMSPWEYEVICYASADKVMKNKYTLVIFDEHQHLPANTYAKLSLIKTKYRIGTTATPWREDGRIDLIFALTGFPLGLSWEQFLKMKVISKPYVEVIIVHNLTEKFRTLDDLLDSYRDKVLIFCDSIDLGKRISKKYSVPFVYGATRKRLQVLRSSNMCVVSRVGDEGLDLTDLKTIVEFDFLFGSRRQQAQRVGRLLHSRFKGRHFILMTKEEFEKYRKRLYSLYEKGFQIKITSKVRGEIGA